MLAPRFQYRDVRPKIRDGDVLLFRPRRRGVFGRLIARIGRSEYSHVGMAAWWNGRLMCLETVQWRGGRAVLLSNLVKHRPEGIDVYRMLSSGFCPASAVNAMLEITGRPYGWRALAAVAISHAIVSRLLLRPRTDDTANGTLPFCSAAVSRALRAGGIDPVPHLADRATEPGDLARSAALHWIFRLVAEPQASPKQHEQDQRIPYPL